MENLGEHPFNYRMDDIRDHINDLVDIGEFDLAVKSIENIKIQYVSGINSSKIDCFRIPFYHLKNHLHSDSNHAIFGTKYPDGSKYLLIHELNQLMDWVKSIQNEAANQKVFDSKKTKYKDGASIERLALLLYFQNERLYNHNFEIIAKEYKFKNGVKLKKVFSVLTKPIRRHGNCKELESHTQKINRIEEYQWAIKRLPEERKEKAIDEMKTLESRLTIEE